MTKTDLATFRELLRAKQIELSGKSLSLERIAIERSADELEEAEYKSLREMAIAGLNRESAMRSIELALRRITDRSFGVCVHCGEEVKRRRLEAVPWTPFCIRCQEAADRGDEGVLESIQSTFLDAA